MLSCPPSRSRFLRVVTLLGCLLLSPAVEAQVSPCAEYRAELSMIERAAGGQGPAPGEVARLQHAWQQMGCARSLPFFNSSSGACESLSQRIAQLQEGPRLSRASAARHAELSRLVATYCQAGPRPREARGSSIQFDQGNALNADAFEKPLSITPESSIIVEDIKPQVPPPVNATCVRLCDGFPFPLSVSPGGREGADQMCQALCPGAKAKAFFKNGGALMSAVDSDGGKYASLSTAGLYKKQLDPACTCKPQGQTWHSALRRADELAGSDSEDTIVRDEPMKNSELNTLRGSAQPQSPIKKRIGPPAIDPDDEPLPIEKPHSGIVHLTPLAPVRSQPPKDVSPARSEPGEKKPVRVIAQPPGSESIPLLADPRKPPVKTQ